MPEDQLKVSELRGCEVDKLIGKKIPGKVAIDFAEFMEIVLYHPQLGYYSKEAATQDYYTNVDVHSVYAEILARFFYRQWKNEFQGQKNFSLVELGAGEGKLAGQILSWTKSEARDFYQALTYICVEKGTARRQSCEALAELFPERLKAEEHFDFRPGSLAGIVFSNEFFDALPFHRVLRQDGRLKEIKIGPDLKETLADLSEPLQDYFDWLGESPPEGCIAEAQISARSWMSALGKALKKGMVLTIDYGFEARELFSETRPQGTALCHFRHKTNRDFYDRLGEQDITAHVNFTALAKEGQALGLKASALASQTQFIAGNGLEEAVKRVVETADPKGRLKISSALKSLIHPEGMGGVFKVLVQVKGER